MRIEIASERHYVFTFSIGTFSKLRFLKQIRCE
jgi:hypothetical protein